VNKKKGRQESGVGKGTMKTGQPYTGKNLVRRGQQVGPRMQGWDSQKCGGKVGCPIVGEQGLAAIKMRGAGWEES